MDQFLLENSQNSYYIEVYDTYLQYVLVYFVFAESTQ